MTEVWKPIPGWAEYYEVSDQGRVRSKDRFVLAKGASAAMRRGRVLTPVAKNNRYLAVTLADGEDRRQYFIHDLVLLAFVGRKPLGHHVCHENCDLSDNRFSNLRYDTPRGNAADTIRAGRRPRGRQHHMAKLTEEDVRVIRSSRELCDDVAARYGICPAHVSSIRNRRCWKHVA